MINHQTCIKLGFLFKLNLLWLLVLWPRASHHSDPVRFQMLYQTLPPSKRSDKKNIANITLAHIIVKLKL